MTSVKISVEHADNHEPNAEQISRALASELRSRGLKRDGDYTVRASTITSGGPSSLTVDVPTTESGKTPAKRAKARVERTDGSEIEPGADGVVTLETTVPPTVTPETP